MATNERKFLRCAVYTRKSSEHGLEQDFNSLDAQREAAEAYIKSQANEGWRLLKTHYDDGGLSGATFLPSQLHMRDRNGGTGGWQSWSPRSWTDC